MRRFHSAILWIALITLWILTSPSHLRAEPPAGAGQPPERRELIVLLAQGTDVPSPEEVVESVRQHRPLSGGLGEGSPFTARFVLPHRAEGVTAQRLQQNPDSPRARLERYIVLSYPLPANLTAIRRALEANPWVLSVEENQLFYFSVTPNDPLFQLASTPVQYQWGSYVLNLPAAWDRIQGHAYIGLADTGLQIDHEDLRAFSVSAGTVVYDGGNFRPQFSWNFEQGESNVDERRGGQTSAGHGTHVSGIVAANADNGKGVAGACWHCNLMMAKLPQRTFWADSVASAITWLVDHGAQAISMSLFTRPTDPNNSLVDTALAFAEERDVAMFASSGNNRTDIQYPARDSRVVAVGGIQPVSNGLTWAFWEEAVCPYPTPPPGSLCTANNCECGSNYTVTPGSKMQDLVAPARDVLSTFYTSATWNTTVRCADSTSQSPGDPGYGLCTGTSMSSPYVTGVAGLLRSANPLLSKANVRSLLIEKASQRGSWDARLGYGVPDAAASVDGALGQVGGRVLANRLTPLFSLYSSEGQDYFYTTFPQMASAAIFGQLQGNCVRQAYDSCSTSSIPYRPVGPLVPGYSVFPGIIPCNVSPCVPTVPRASVYIFSGDKPVLPGAPPLVPLYRMSYRPLSASDLNRDVTYTTETSGILAFHSDGYELDGIEGYIYKRCTPEPSCIPAGAVRLYRLYNYSRDDYAIFPESELAQFQAAGYVSVPGYNDWIGYVYPNTDSDGDNVINGFESLIGTNPGRADSDCDGLNDGTEILTYPYRDPLSSPGCINNAQVLSQSVPAAMVVGQTYSVSMTLKNTGTLTWSPVGAQCGAYRLGSVNANWNPTRAELAAAVAPGQQVTLNFTVTAPSTAGTYNFQWRMVQE